MQHLLRQAKQIQETTISEIVKFKEREEAGKVKKTTVKPVVLESPDKLKAKPKKSKAKIKKGS